MGLFRKPAKKKIGLKALVVGERGVGKTRFALTFPDIAALDSENGMTFYEDTEDGKNLKLVANTQSFYDLEDSIDEIADVADDEGIKTIVIDSESKFYANIQETIMNVEEKRARRKGRDVLDANLSVRSWGKIKQISEKLQNKKIDLSSQGINIVSVSQIKDKKEKIGEDFQVVGFDIVMSRGADYDYDLILKLFTEEDGTDISYKGKVLKDRTGTFKTGEIVDNPTYDLWADRVENGGEKLDTSYSNNKDEDKYEEAVEEEGKTIVEKMKDLIANADKETKEKIGEELKSAKIPPGADKLTAKKAKKLEEIYEKFSG